MNQDIQPYHPNDLEIYMDYQAKRDAPPPVPYTPPQNEVQTYTTRKAVSDLVKPVAILSALAGGVYMVGVCAVAVGAAIMTTVAAYAVPIGGTVAAVVTLVLCFFGYKSTKDEAMNQAPPNDGGKYEWYQEQRQGWRKM